MTESQKTNEELKKEIEKQKLKNEIEYYKNQNENIKKNNQLIELFATKKKKWSIIRLIFDVILLILLIVGIVLAINIDTIVGTILLVLTIAGAIITSIFSIIFSIQIISKKFYNEELDDSKLLWGLLAILLLGEIANIVFCLKCKKELKKNN